MADVIRELIRQVRADPDFSARVTAELARRQEALPEAMRVARELPATIERVLDNIPAADRILVARIQGTARRYACWHELTEPEHAAAVGALREVAAGRADLLAQVSGILEGFGEGKLDELLVRQAASLCRAAGADETAIPAWTEEGRRRAAAAGLPPFSGGVHGGGARRF